MKKYRIADARGEKLLTNDAEAVRECLKAMPRQTDAALSIFYTEEGKQLRIDCENKAGVIADKFAQALTDEETKSTSVAAMRKAILMPLEVPASDTAPEPDTEPDTTTDDPQAVS
jgi:hypothetical protein